MTRLPKLLATAAMTLALLGCDDKTDDPVQLTDAEREKILHPHEGELEMLALPPYSRDLEAKLGSDYVIVRAQPAVYRINVYGHQQLIVPKDVSIDMNAIQTAWSASADRTHASDREALARFAWQQIAARPEDLLRESGEAVVRTEPRGLLCSGTGFMVSHEGIVVTNAHVVSDHILGSVASEVSDPQGLASVLGGTLKVHYQSLQTAIGGAPGNDEEEAQALQALLSWLATRSRVDGKFDQARLVLQLTVASPRPEQLKGITLLELLNRPPVEMALIEAPLTVLKKGEVMPGRDVAILRADKGGWDPGKEWDPIDKSVCLPLSEDDDVMPGTRVQALGFPGVAFNPRLMMAGAEYRCSAQNGQVSGTKPMAGGWDALEMTADINHGDSGGPVLDERGFVIGINVGSARNASGHTLAVPIRLAKRMLDELGIKPDPGPVTALWMRSLEDFKAGRYKPAERELNGVLEIQAMAGPISGTPIVFGHGPGPAAGERTNLYVREMKDRAAGKASPMRKKQPS